MAENKESYIENFNKLRQVVGEMQSMTEPDVDALVPFVESGTAAYKVCMGRIDAVEKMLGLDEESKQAE
jgi:exodeoxyribonuclease VII small subunit